MRLASIAVISGLSLAAAACGSDRAGVQIGDTCRHLPGGPAVALTEPAPHLLHPKVPAVAPAKRDLTLDPRNADSVTSLAELMTMLTRGRADKAYHILAISGGGQWGAFSAGILMAQHKSSTPPKPDLVTGISTGALIAPLAFLGDSYSDPDSERDYYESLRKFYTTADDDAVYTMRNPLLLITADSITDNAPLKAVLYGKIDDIFVQRLAAEYDAGRRLLVQSVDLDKGQSIAFDLTEIAHGSKKYCGDGVSARDCIINAILAAASLPVVFPPTFIKGEMFVDGGLLQGAFSVRLALGVARRPAAAANAVSVEHNFVLSGDLAKEADAVAPDVTLLVSSDLQTDTACPRDGFLQIAERVSGIAVDQIAADSFYRLLTESKAEGATVRYGFADPALTNCSVDPKNATGSLDLFNTVYMQCLYTAACMMVVTDDNRLWHTNPEDLPGSPLIPRSRGALLGARRTIPDYCLPAKAS